MNVLFITQCDKRALKETRRILDQFAERKGARTWQTSITQIGLDTVRKLLRQTARRNTAVACHWLHGQGQCDVVWIVGDASRFNTEGTVPTHTTERNILRQNDENDWATAEDIRLLAQMAALLHDLGKASVEFQNRLRTRKEGPNLYRHEWVSLRLFQAFVGAETDSEWLTRLATEQYTVTDWTAAERYQQDGINTDEKYPFRKLPPLAAALGWLVVTHHRLPVAPAEKQDGSGQEYWGKRRHKINLGELEQPLADVTHAWNACDTVA
ncbi:MAG: CRISPR-associated endonuclease Cas3'', partial [Acetobacter sp.]|nr:CRISPR-associated endonuclease Cas3'' [Acetobacter sp.]